MNDDSELRRDEAFSATSWTVVMNALAESERSIAAMDQLCRKYYQPIFRFIQRRGNDEHDAADLSQGFFFEVINNKRLRSPNRTKGKFRAYLLAAVKGYLINHYHHQRADKRGGGEQVLSLDAGTEEGQRKIEPGVDFNADMDFDREWAQALFSQVRQLLQTEYELKGKSEEFQVLKGHIDVAESVKSHDAIAKQLGLNANAVGVAIHRLRQRFREILKEEINNLVGKPEEIEGELRYMYSLLSSSAETPQ